jgi:hypothetical protein
LAIYALKVLIHATLQSILRRYTSFGVLLHDIIFYDVNKLIFDLRVILWCL